jgi:hypothetical protein
MNMKIGAKAKRFCNGSLISAGQYEDRNPRAETRKKPEIRMPFLGLRISAFGASAFGFGHGQVVMGVKA